MAKNKSMALLVTALQAFKRGEKEIAKDIFALAAEEDDALKALGEDAEPAFDPEAVKAKMAKALQENDLDTAQACMDQLKAGASAPETEETVAPEATGSEDEDVNLDEADGEEDEEELSPQVSAKLLTIARKITAAGHPELAKRITSALAGA